MELIMKPWQVIDALEQKSGRLDKEQIVADQATAGNNEFFEGCRLALDNMITFGIKQVPEKKDEDGPGLDWDSFASLAGSLRDRALTGNDARDAVATAVTQATKAQWNSWYRRILIKDLRCGTSEKTINKAVEKINASYVIPVFSCQLAHDSTNHESKVAGKKYIEVKLDGVRVLTIVHPNGTVNLFSRNGKSLDNFPVIANQISAVAGQFTEPMVLDGEVMSASFQDLMKQVHRKSDVQSDDAVLNLFDIIPLNKFVEGGWDKGQEDRSEMVYKWHKANASVLPNVAVVGHELVDLSTAEGKVRFKEINKLAIDGGYEGIMIKEPNAPYECKRSTSWLKLKPFIEVSLTVVAVEEGTGKNVGKLGALVCEGVDDGDFIRVNVGSGFTDEMREEIWKDTSLVLGQIVEIRADAKTRSQDSDEVYSLRFPRFLRFRGFEAGDKI